MSDRRKNTDRHMGDRRDDPRLDSSVNMLRFLRPGVNSGHVQHGELLDASRSSVQLLLNEQLEPSETMLIEL